MQAPPREDEPSAGSLKRALGVGLLIFVILLAVLAVVAWFAGDALLPMEYEGFD
jgi:hypothetical protein